MLSKQHTNITIKLLWISAFVLIQLLVSGVMLAQEVCVCGGGGWDGETRVFIECSSDAKLLNKTTK